MGASANTSSRCSGGSGARRERAGRGRSGPEDAGRANYQVALTVCDACGRGWQEGRGERVEVGTDVVEMASCDAQHIGRIAANSAHVGATPRATQEVPPAVRRLVIRR